MQLLETPLSDAEIEQLDGLLSSIHAPFEPMDVSALDGYLCGVLLQPVTISVQEWLPLVFDIEGRPVPDSDSTRRTADLAQRRLHELNAAVEARQWFDPWIFEGQDDDLAPAESQLPWVAGFAAAMDRFPRLLALDNPALLEPLAVLYAAFDPDDLEDAEELLPLIEAMEPPSTLAEAAEDLVRSVMLLADVSRPQRGARGGGGRGGGRPRAGGGGRPGGAQARRTGQRR